MTVRGKKYPTKTRINLAQKERKNQDLGSVILTAVILAVAISAFCKFAVVNRLNAVTAADAQAEQQEQLLEQVRQQTKDYDTVLQEYESNTAIRNETNGGVDPMACLDLIDSELLRYSQVHSFAVGSGIITAKISGVTLNDISEIYQDLMASKLVSGVQVYTAENDGKDSTSAVTATMTIRLAVSDAAAGGEAAS